MSYTLDKSTPKMDFHVNSGCQKTLKSYHICNIFFEHMFQCKKLHSSFAWAYIREGLIPRDKTCSVGIRQKHHWLKMITFTLGLPYRCLHLMLTRYYSTLISRSATSHHSGIVILPKAWFMSQQYIFFLLS